MKLSLKIFAPLLILLCISCGGEDKSNDTTESDTTNSDTVESNTTTSESSTTTTLAPIEDPCKTLSSSDITAIDGFQESSEGTANLAGSETWKICDFVVDSRNLSVSLKRYDDRIIETKGVEKTYQGMLETQDKLTRTEVQGTPGDQAIYTHGRKGPIYSYTLQWRFENHTEGMLAISFPDEQNADNLLKQLVAIAVKMGE